MALIYRAHFAFSKNPRINSKGLNTGVMMGFTNTLLEVLKKENPTHIAVAFDTKAPTFRHQQFETYKANRQEQPEDIEKAIPWVKEIVKAYNIPCIELDGYEADDIIGTIAKKAARSDFEVYMMTPDKDYGQLVEEHIFLYKPAFMGNGVDVMGPKEVCAKWDIESVDQVRDILGLMGDAVDNIPGIPGIGEKTAVKLLKEYGTIENLLQHTDDLKGKQKENVVNFGPQGLLSKELATIEINVPIEFDEAALHYDGPNEDQLKAIFEELEFRTLSKRVFGEDVVKSTKKNATPDQLDMFSAAPAKEEETAVEETLPYDVQATGKDNIHTVAHDYYVMDSPAKRKMLISYLLKQKEFCFDTETTALDAYEAELVGLSFSYKAKEAYYVPMPADQTESKAILEEFRPVFENEQILKIAQNIKYDMLVLKNYDMEVKGSYL